MTGWDRRILTFSSRPALSCVSALHKGTNNDPIEREKSRMRQLWCSGTMKKIDRSSHFPSGMAGSPETSIKETLVAWMLQPDLF